jgi:hypothetical protein
MSADKLLSVKITGRALQRAAEIGNRAAIPTRAVLDLLVQRFGDQLERDLTQPVRTEPRVSGEERP